ncbi:MAG TPA: hypothetical protein VEW93_04615 [Acidimicrobiales bacterium]|nr:hypothetical protein [Acidimicrobiales bacterium]
MSWDPGFRGILTVGVGVAVLMGSVYLLLATNSGARLGFLLSLTGLAGWMMIMGLVWSMYGIGYQGRVATWHVEEVNFGDLTVADDPEARTVPPRDELPEPRELIQGNADLERQFPDDPTRRAPQLGDLLSVDPDLAEEVPERDGWHILAAADPQTGEAVAAASAFLTEEQKFPSADGFVVLDAWSKGGKDRRSDDSLLGRALFKAGRIATWPLGHPPHRVVVRTQAVIPRETVAGQPPATPQADEEQPVVSVVMVRDLGSRRQPAIFLTIASAILFAVCCNSLHRRDKLVAEARAAGG